MGEAKTIEEAEDGLKQRSACDEFVSRTESAERKLSLLLSQIKNRESLTAPYAKTLQEMESLRSSAFTQLKLLSTAQNISAPNYLDEQSKRWTTFKNLETKLDSLSREWESRLLLPRDSLAWQLKNLLTDPDLSPSSKLALRKLIDSLPKWAFREAKPPTDNIKSTRLVLDKLKARLGEIDYLFASRKSAEIRGSVANAFSGAQREIEAQRYILRFNKRFGLSEYLHQGPIRIAIGLTLTQQAKGESLLAQVRLAMQKAPISIRDRVRVGLQEAERDVKAVVEMAKAPALRRAQLLQMNQLALKKIDVKCLEQIPSAARAYASARDRLSGIAESEEQLTKAPANLYQLALEKTWLELERVTDACGSKP
jgi:hypothetical protein